jgi:GT2 family glycosyltransferase
MSDPVTGPAVLFSIVTPVYNTAPDVLDEMVGSVLAQTHERWELLLVDDASTEASVVPQLRAFAAADPRVKVIERAENGHIVAASNDGVRAATGDFIVLLDHDDLLTPDALERNAAAIELFDDVDYLYSDEDKIDAEGGYYDHFRKPAWSPERLRGQMYTGHLSVLRTDLVREVGGFHEGFDGSQDHDLVLRVTERARRVVHIPEILYHWRVVPGSAAGDIDAKPYAWVAGRNAVQAHLDRVGIAGEAGYGASPGLYTVSRRLDPAHRVSVVIPTMGSAGLIWGERRVFVVEAVRSLLEHTDHENLEIVVVYDPPTSPATLAELRALAGDKLVLVPFDEVFNFSRKMNLGALHSTGDRLVLLNDDVQVRSERWLEELVAPLDEPDVGMTGAKLYFSNDLLQHAGHAYERGHYLHESIDAPRESLGTFGMLGISRDVSGVTAACAGIRRDTFMEVGGFTEELPANFNDVDLCYKVRFVGKRIIVVATCELYHFESRTRERVVADWERVFVNTRWGIPWTDRYSSRVRKGVHAHDLDVWQRDRAVGHGPSPA